MENKSLTKLIVPTTICSFVKLNLNTNGENIGDLQGEKKRENETLLQ